MPKNRFTDYLELHFVVLLFGFTGILGKLISIPALPLSAFRMIIASAGLYLFLKVKGIKLNVKRGVIISSLGVGIIVALHWFTFFLSIKLSNVSVALATLSSATLFAAILEPIIEKRRISVLEVVLSLFIIAGLVLIFSFELTYWKGIIMALISAFLASLFNVLNRGLTQNNDSTVISFFEMLSGALILSIVLFITELQTGEVVILSVSDIVLLVILGLVCTSYAFTAVVRLMKRLTAYTVTMSVNLEPIYAIILAWFIFGDSELMSKGFYAGAIIIILSIIIHSAYTSMGNKSA